MFTFVRSVHLLYVVGGLSFTGRVTDDDPLIWDSVITRRLSDIMNL